MLHPSATSFQNREDASYRLETQDEGTAWCKIPGKASMFEMKPAAYTQTSSTSSEQITVGVTVIESSTPQRAPAAACSREV